MLKIYKHEKYSLRYVIPRLQGSCGLAGIWGCTSHKGPGPSNIYTGRINQYSYKDTLENWTDRKLAKYKITSVENLKQQLSEIWVELPKDYCIKLIESMPRHIQKCIKVKGGYFKY